MHPILVNTPVITQADRDAVDACMAAGWVSSEAPHVSLFEQAFADYCGRQHGIAVSSGTAALDVAVRALDLGPGDEVLVPSMTIISCASSIVASGATPVPVDCDPLDWNAHLQHFQEKFTPRTRAVILVHIYGLCADIDPILDWAKSNELLVIEDASQAIGLKYRQRPCGSHGHCSVFSLYANKLITAGEGGVVVTDDPIIEERCRQYRNLCFNDEKRFWHHELGWNYRMTAMQAALALSQLQRVEELVSTKRAMGERYRSALAELREFATAPEQTSYCSNIYWVFGLVVKPNAGFSREEIISHLASRQIGTRTFFYGLHEQPALLNGKIPAGQSLSATQELSSGGFYLPSGLGLTEEDQNIVIDCVLEFVAQ